MKLFVCPASRVEAAISDHAPSHLLTLISPGAAAPLCPSIPDVGRLDLRFHDIAEPRDGLLAPSREMVERLLSFGLAWPARAPLLIHCYAGVSRSTAAAYVLSCARAGPGREEALAVQLRTASASATPNPLIVALGDALLKRNGRMIAAIAALGRGANAFEGEVFSMTSDRQAENVVRAGSSGTGGPGSRGGAR